MNSTILAWQYAGYNVAWWLLAISVWIYMIVAFVASKKADRNGKHLRRPVVVADHMNLISFRVLRRQYSCLKIIVIDCELTCSGMWARKMDPSAVNELKHLMLEGWYIVVASKSNRHLAQMHREQFDNDPRMLYIRKAHKGSSQFMVRVINLIRQERPVWKIDTLLLETGHEDHLFILVGDKLTDMGSYEAEYIDYTIGVLTNRQFKRFGFMYDWPTEIFPMLRRYLENRTLKAMGVNRAEPGECRAA